MRIFIAVAGLLGVLLAGCQSSESPSVPANAESETVAKASVAKVLDTLHLRAASADYEGYFDLFHSDAVFMGTDRQEYWPLAEFKRYTKARFAKGVGWTYVPTERFIHLRGDVAWFEERVVHEQYGETRGTGVLVREAGRWLITQYNLVLPIPNDLFDRYAQEIFNYYRR